MDTWIEWTTQHPPTWWVATVQRLIKKHSRRGKDPRHDETDPVKWLADLVAVVLKQLPPPGPEPTDQNMRAAQLLGYVLCLWYSRVHWGKIHDPRRPVALRKRAYSMRHAWVGAVLEAMTDIQHDGTHFPDQEWENPFVAEARSGSFV